MAIGRYKMLLIFLTTLKTWLLAIRPKTLSAAIAPVLIGTAMAFRDGVQHLPTALLCLLAAVTIQIATNLANDYFDYKKGTDTSDRIGPKRVTAAGLVQPQTMKKAFILAFALAAVFSVPLILRGGWPILVIAILSILSGILYTAGPRPLGYLGLGEIFVFIFFGPVAVGGTYYVQSLTVHPAVILAGLGPGFLAMAILVVNNLRDIESDRRSGKKTLAVRFGRKFARREYLWAIAGGSLIPAAVYLVSPNEIPYEISFIDVVFFAILLRIPGWLVFSLLAIPSLRIVFRKSDGPSLNKALAYTSFLLLIYTVLFSLSLIWPVPPFFLNSKDDE